MKQFRVVLAVESYKDGRGRFIASEWRVIDTIKNRYLDCLVSDRIGCDRHARFLNEEVPKQVAIGILKDELEAWSIHKRLP